MISKNKSILWCWWFLQRIWAHIERRTTKWWNLSCYCHFCFLCMYEHS